MRCIAAALVVLVKRGPGVLASAHSPSIRPTGSGGSIWCGLITTSPNDIARVHVMRCAVLGRSGHASRCQLLQIQITVYLEDKSAGHGAFWLRARATRPSLSTRARAPVLISQPRRRTYPACLDPISRAETCLQSTNSSPSAHFGRPPPGDRNMRWGSAQQPGHPRFSIARGGWGADRAPSPPAPQKGSFVDWNLSKPRGITSGPRPRLSEEKGRAVFIKKQCKTSNTLLAKCGPCFSIRSRSVTVGNAKLSAYISPLSPMKSIPPRVRLA